MGEKFYRLRSREEYASPQPPRRRLFIFYLEDWRTRNSNPTSAEINLSQAKNGLDNGIHLSHVMPPRFFIRLRFKRSVNTELRSVRFECGPPDRAVVG